MSVFPPVNDLNSISPTVLYTGSGDKRDFLTYFYMPLASALLMYI